MNLNYTSSLCKAKASCCLRAPPKPASGKQRFNFPGRWRASEQRVDSVCVHLPVLTADRLPGLSSALWPPPDLSPRVQSTSQSLATLEGSSASEPTLHQVQPPVSGVSGPPQPPPGRLGMPFPCASLWVCCPSNNRGGNCRAPGLVLLHHLTEEEEARKEGGQPGGPDQQVQAPRLSWLRPHVHPSVQWVLSGSPPSWTPRDVFRLGLFGHLCVRPCAESFLCL